MLAFPVGQVRQSCCGTFQRALRHKGRNLHLWDDLRSLVYRFAFPDQEKLYRVLAGELGGEDHIGPIRDGLWTPPARRANHPPQFNLNLAKHRQNRTGRTPPGHRPCAPETQKSFHADKTAGKSAENPLAGITGVRLIYMDLRCGSSYQVRLKTGN
ncbi:MAG: hypothetical protein OXC66_00575 [Roseovarius sp.]|nr:hypothetical protein [Roseovarius sp.]